jgi:acetyltransferase-like isoleucine patch superfamily enzyme
MTETLKPRAANVGPVQRRYGKPQMVAEKIAMAAQRSVLFPSRWRPALLRLFGAEVGRNIRIAQHVFIGQPSNLTIEDGVVVNVGAFIDCSAPVSIGERSRIGYQVMILTGSHQAENSVYRRKEGNHVRRPIRIERGCWVQSRAMIGPGVTMAEGCTLLAYGVLLKSTTSNGEYAGLPATRTRDLSTADDQTDPLPNRGFVSRETRATLLADAEAGEYRTQYVFGADLPDEPGQGVEGPTEILRHELEVSPLRRHDAAEVVLRRG